MSLGRRIQRYFTGGDLLGREKNPKVVKIQGVPVTTTAPSDGQFLKYVSANSQWEPAAVGSGSGDFTQNIAFSGDISPAQLTADQNDWNPTGLSTASTVRLSTDASRNITGLQGGADGRLIILHNTGSQNAVLKDESASSSAANRFALNADVTLGADQAAMLQYDTTSSRWRLVAGPSSGGSGSIAPLNLTDANTVEQYNSTNNQNFSVYRNRNSSTDYQRIRVGWTGTSAELMSEAATQSASNLTLKIAGGTGLNLSVDSLVPAANITFVLGSASNYFNEIYNNAWITRSGGMLRFVGGARMTGPASGILNWTDDSSNSGSGTIRFDNRTPAQITADQNNYSIPVTGYFIRLSTDASRTLTGLTFGGGGKGDGQVHLLVNVGSNDLVLAHQSASSTDSNRFLCSTGANITLSANQAADIIYDGVTERWRVFKRG